MAKTYRLGVVGMVHDHVWGELRHWKNRADVEIVAAADPNQPLLDKVGNDYGVQKLYHTWQEMLEKEQFDILQVAATNAGTYEPVVAAAAKGIHVVSEKPMSARLWQADLMLEAARKNNTKLLINWPNAWSPEILTLFRMIKDGSIGQPIYFKYRAAHNGPKEIGCSEYFWKWLYNEDENGAGALMDYCCYSSAMNAYLFGQPQEVTGIRAVLAKDYPLPDDNAIILMKFAKAFGVAEASWTQPVSYPIPNPICHGTNGCLYMAKGSLWIQTTADKEARKVEPDPRHDYRASAASYLIHAIESGEAIEGMCDPVVSRNAQEILEAGYLSSNTGRTMKIPLGNEAIKPTG